MTSSRQTLLEKQINSLFSDESLNAKIAGIKKILKGDLSPDMRSFCWGWLKFCEEKYEESLSYLESIQRSSVSDEIWARKYFLEVQAEEKIKGSKTKFINILKAYEYTESDHLKSTIRSYTKIIYEEKYPTLTSIFCRLLAIFYIKEGDNAATEPLITTLRTNLLFREIAEINERKGDWDAVYQNLADGLNQVADSRAYLQSLDEIKTHLESKFTLEQKRKYQSQIAMKYDTIENHMQAMAKLISSGKDTDIESEFKELLTRPDVTNEYAMVIKGWKCFYEENWDAAVNYLKDTKISQTSGETYAKSKYMQAIASEMIHGGDVLAGQFPALYFAYKNTTNENLKSQILNDLHIFKEKYPVYESDFSYILAACYGYDKNSQADDIIAGLLQKKGYLYVIDLYILQKKFVAALDLMKLAHSHAKSISDLHSLDRRIPDLAADMSDALKEKYSQELSKKYNTIENYLPMLMRLYQQDEKRAAGLLIKEIVQKSDVREGDKNFCLGLQSFHQEKWADAISYFKKIKKTDAAPEIFAQASFILTQAMEMQNGVPGDCVQIFEAYVSTRDKSLQNEIKTYLHERFGKDPTGSIEYYLACILVFEKDYQSAERLIQNISNEKRYFYLADIYQRQRKYSLAYQTLKDGLMHALSQVRLVRYQEVADVIESNLTPQDKIKYASERAIKYDSPDNHLEVIRKLFKASEHEKAQTELANFLQRSNLNDVQQNMAQGWICFYQEQWDACIEHLEKIKSTDLVTKNHFAMAKFLTALADEASQGKESEFTNFIDAFDNSDDEAFKKEIIALLNVLAREYPHNHHVHYALAYCYCESGDKQAAEPYIDEFIAQGRFIIAAGLYNRQNSIECAYASLAEGFMHEATSSDHLWALDKVRNRIDKKATPQAKELFYATYKILPFYDTVANHLAVIEKQIAKLTPKDRVIAEFDAVEKRQELSAAEKTYCLGWRFFYEENWQLAFEHLKTIVDTNIDPEMLSRVLFMLSVSGRHLKHSNDSSDFIRSYGSTKDIKFKQKIRQYLLQCLHENPDETNSFYFRLAICCLADNNPQEAQLYIGQLRPEKSHFNFYLGRIHLFQHDFPEALQAFDLFLTKCYIVDLARLDKVIEYFAQSLNEAQRKTFANYKFAKYDTLDNCINIIERLIQNKEAEGMIKNQFVQIFQRKDIDENSNANYKTYLQGLQALHLGNTFEALDYFTTVSQTYQDAPLGTRALYQMALINYQQGDNYFQATLGQLATAYQFSSGTPTLRNKILTMLTNMLDALLQKLPVDLSEREALLKSDQKLRDNYQGIHEVLGVVHKISAETKTLSFSAQEDLNTKGAHLEASLTLLKEAAKYSGKSPVAKNHLHSAQYLYCHHLKTIDHEQQAQTLLDELTAANYLPALMGQAFDAVTPKANRVLDPAIVVARFSAVFDRVEENKSYVDIKSIFEKLLPIYKVDYVQREKIDKLIERTLTLMAHDSHIPDNNKTSVLQLFANADFLSRKVIKQAHERLKDKNWELVDRSVANVCAPSSATRMRIANPTPLAQAIRNVFLGNTAGLKKVCAYYQDAKQKNKTLLFSFLVLIHFPESDEHKQNLYDISFPYFAAKSEKEKAQLLSAFFLEITSPDLCSVNSIPFIKKHFGSSDAWVNLIIGLNLCREYAISSLMINDKGLVKTEKYLNDILMDVLVKDMGLGKSDAAAVVQEKHDLAQKAIAAQANKEGARSSAVSYPVVSDDEEDYVAVVSSAASTAVALPTVRQAGLYAKTQIATATKNIAMSKSEKVKVAPRQLILNG